MNRQLLHLGIFCVLAIVAAGCGSSNSTSDSAEISALFNRYEAYFEQGNWDRVADLYASSVTFSIEYSTSSEDPELTCSDQDISELPQGIEIIDCVDNERLTLKIARSALRDFLPELWFSADQEAPFEVEHALELTSRRIHGSGNNRIVTADFTITIIITEDNEKWTFRIFGAIEHGITKAASGWTIHQETWRIVGWENDDVPFN